MIKHPFHHILHEFIKFTGLELDLPPADQLESFDFVIDHTKCVVIPNEDESLVIGQVAVMRLDEIPLKNRAVAMRMLHALNSVALFSNQVLATVNADDEIYLAKVIHTHRLTGESFSEELAVLFESAGNLLASLRILAKAEEIPAEYQAYVQPPCPLQMA
jgi:hypothetical protein